MKKRNSLFRKIFIVMMTLSIYVPGFLSYLPQNTSPILAATTTYTSQADFMGGKYEYGEIDALSSAGNIKLQADLGTWDASGPAYLNHNVNTNTKLIKAGNFLYVFRNRQIGQFMRYDLSTREWKEMAYTPIQPFEVVDATTNNTDTIWAFATRNGRKHFFKYYIPTDTWTFLDSTPLALTTGSTLQYVPGATNYVYAFQGGGTSFWRYNITNNSWSQLANAVATCTSFCSLEYDGSQYLYLATDALAPDRFYRYDTVNGGLWVAQGNLPIDGAMNYGSDLIKYGSDYYVMRSAGTQTFYKYNAGVWAAVKDVPFVTTYASMVNDSDNNRIIAMGGVGEMAYYYPATNTWSSSIKGPPANVYQTGNIISSDGAGNFYMCRGQSTNTCYKYVLATDTWTATTVATATLGTGASSAYVNGKFYVHRGTLANQWYAYDGATWTTPTAPGVVLGDGSAMVASGSGSTGAIFAVQGGASTGFYRFDVNTNLWTGKAPALEVVYRGSGLAQSGLYTYLLNGGQRGKFSRYSEVANSWEELNSLPIGSYYGGGLVSDGSNYIYAFVGGENDEWAKRIYRYSISGDTWTRMADAPAMMRFGGGATFYNGSIYVYNGYGGSFWKYTPPTTTYKASGTWHSPVQDLISVSAFGDFTVTDSTPAGTGITYFTRTSDNQNVWDNWAQVTGVTINSTPRRYVQTKAVLTGNGTATPTLSDIALNYTGDSSVPNVGSLVLSAKSQKGSATTITTGNTYSYTNPYFSWTGVSDAESGMDGYYVYFGTSSSGDPVTLGNFQQTTDYSVNTAMVAATPYYLRIAPKNKAGTTPVAATYFTYTYNGNSPAITATVANMQDQWDSTEATKSGTYSASSAWWNQSYLYRRQLTVTSPSVASPGATIKVTLDTAALVTAGKLRSDRNDWRIGYWDGTFWKDVDRQYVDATTTYFPLVKGLAAGGSDTNYYAYYGNSGEITTPPQSFQHAQALSVWGSALRFDGNDYAKIPNSITGQSNLTIEGWFQYYNSSAARWIYGENAAAPQVGIAIPAAANWMYYNFKTLTAGTFTGQLGTTLLVPGTWNHFAIVYDSTAGTFKAFINGRLDASRAGLSGAVSVTGGVQQQLGASNAAFHYGLIDEVRISNTARYSAEFTSPTSMFTNDANTLALYHFDSNTGTQTVTDSSSNNNTGSLGLSAGALEATDPQWTGDILAAVGSESAVPGSAANTSLTLQPLPEGSWAGYQISSLPYGARMQNGTSLYANNSLYVLRGNNSTAFYKQDVTSGAWTQLTDIPLAANGPAMAWDGADAIYVIRGAATTTFYKYTISTNTWTASIDQPIYTFTTGSTITRVGNMFYMGIGGGSTTMLSFNKTYESLVDGNDAWSTLQFTPYGFSQGSGLVSDGSNTLWLVAGSSTGFAKYTISSDTWDSTISAPALAPYFIGYSSNNAIFKNNKIYTFTSYDFQANGEAKHFIWSYDIATDMWQKIDNNTEWWSYTGSIAYDSSRYAYLIQGYGNGAGGNTAVVRYDLDTNSFLPETPPLPQDRLYQADGEAIVHQVSTGTSMAFDGSDTIYMIQGLTANTVTNVNKYQVSTKKWSMIPNIPCSYAGGMVYANNKLFAFCGNGTKKSYSYDPLTNDWTMLANNPGNGGETITSAGSQIAAYNGNDDIYVLRGGGTTTLYRYTISSNTWTTESTLIPGAIGNNYGASLVYDGSQYLYVARGNNTPDFYRYNTTSPGWSTMTALPETVSNGSGTVLSNGKIYVTSSYNNNTLYIYDIATNSWQNGPLAPSQIAAGGTLVKGPGNSMYALQGNTMFTFWKYNLPSTTSSFVSSGSYISKPIDLGKPFAFTGLNATVASPSATSVQFETRTSTDSATWSSWAVTSDLKQNPSSQFVYAINSTVARYIQTRVSMTSAESASTPTVSDINIEYYQDNTAPTNPSSISAYSNQSKTTSLTDSQWYNHTQPYFEWTGSSDGANGSGVAGYYIYFGQNENAVASTSGVFSASANYTTTLAADHSQDGYYYLKVQAVDTLGNIAASTTPLFIYRYIDTTAPSNPNAVSAFSDNTQTATLSAGGTIWYNYPRPYFSWSGASDDAGGSGIAGYYVYFGTESAALASQSGSFQVGTSFNPTMQTDASDAGNYYLNIQVKDTAGNISATNWSAFLYNHLDLTAPSIPTLDVTATSSAALAATINESTWYNGTAPHFEWSGAQDELNGSGVAGYYVYFGSDINALASQSGSFQTGRTYTASLPTDSSVDGSLYLIIQTKDGAGNISGTQTTPFRYKYDHTAPLAIASENVAVLPSGYSAINNFRFLWITTAEQYPNGSGSGFKEYYYKTGTNSGTLSIDNPTSLLAVSDIIAYQEGVNTFKIRAADEAGNYTPYTTVNYYWNKTAPSAPTNLAIASEDAVANSFGFSWDVPATSSAEIKEYRYSVNSIPNVSNISTTSGTLVNGIKGTQDGTNTFYVVAVDTANNVSYGNYASINFSVSVTAPGIPLAPEVFDNSIRASNAYKIGMSWEPPTDKGSAFDRYEVYISETNVECSVSMSTYGDAATSTKGESTQVAYIGTTKLSSKSYYLCVKACATTNQCSSPSTTVTITPSGRWLEAPELIGSQSATVKTKTAIVSWNTNRASNSFVKYGKTSGSYSTEVGSSNQVTYHEISVTGLDPGATYYYQMLWTDEDGNLGKSGELTFATNPAPFVSAVKFGRVNINSASVTFTIKSAIKATVQYGKTLSYGSIQSISTSKDETAYTIEVPALLEGTIYHLRIAAEDDEGNIYNSDDYTFETLPTPKIIGLRVQQVVGMPTSTLRLLWTTNTLASAVVTYYPTNAPQLAVDSISLALKLGHEVIIKNLLDNTDYTILIKGKDASGNEAKTESRSLKTANDVRPPEIQNLNVESTIIGVGEDARAQIVVSWDTDEPSTTQIEYGQGTGTTYNQTTQEDTNKTSNHTVTITGLSPSKIYHLRALSKDKGDNLGQSLDTVIITPKSTKDALNLVIDNLSKTFGFLKAFSQAK